MKVASGAAVRRRRVLREGETAEHDYRHAMKGLGDKYDFVECGSDWPHLHFIDLYYTPPEDTLTLYVPGTDTPVVVGEDGHAQAVVLFSYDACPQFHITVEGTDVSDLSVYRVEVAPNVG